MKQGSWISARGCVYNINYHFVWSTKYRKKVLTGMVEKSLKELHISIADGLGVNLMGQEIMPDHVHLFISAHPKYSPTNLVKVFKGVSARRLFERHIEIRDKLWKGHLWNPSFYIGTAGAVTAETIKRYIETQKER